MAEQTFTQTIYPALSYKDASTAIDWLCRAFGFERHAVHEGEGGAVEHAELSIEGAFIMLGTEGAGSLDWPSGHASNYIVVDDPDGHYERARAAGAEIVIELRDEDYGSRGYTARDPEGNLWSFGTYRPSS
jgi:uncharacterized glyoxalase superfamily protein PhnB